MECRQGGRIYARVDLEHRGWDRLADRQQPDSYDTVLGEFIRAARAAGAPAG